MQMSCWVKQNRNLVKDLGFLEANPSDTKLPELQAKALTNSNLKVTLKNDDGRVIV